jgi:hypothetical protein
MSRPDISNLGPNQSHQTTRYEVEVKLNDRWILDRAYDSLPKAQARVSMNKMDLEDSRVIVVSEIRRLAA